MNHQLSKSHTRQLRTRPKQTAILQSQFKENFLVGGLGAGKSFTIGLFVLNRTRHPGTLGLIAAPSNDVIKNSTLPQVQEAWTKAGIIEDRDYVINRLAPPEWNVKPYSPLNQVGVITFRWGSYCLVGGLDNFNKWRGPEFDYIAVDEFRDVKPQARIVLLGRLRGRAFKKLGLKQQILWATTPPEDFLFLKECIEKPDVFSVFTTSFENRANLPDGYIEDYIGSVDEITAKREIYGELIGANSKPWLYSWDTSKHVSSEVYAIPGLRLTISMDFNLEPMTAIIGVMGKGFAWYIDQIEVKGSIYDVCDEIKYKYHSMPMFLTGDPSGHSREKAIRGTASLFEIAARELGIDRRYEVTGRRKHMLLKDSRTLCNSVIRHHPNFKVHPRCKGVIRDFGNAFVDGEGNLVKSRNKETEFLDHFDCGRYMIEEWFPRWIGNKNIYL